MPAAPQESTLMSLSERSQNLVFDNVSKQCDLSTPECRRCYRAGVRCSGLRDPRTFIHRNATNLGQQSHRMALASALQSRRQLQPASSNSGISNGQAHRPQQITACPPHRPSPHPDIISVLLPGRLTYFTLIEDFKPLAWTGVFSGDRVSRNQPMYSSAAMCIRALLPLTSLKMKWLDLSILSLLMTYMGGLRNDNRLVQLAQSSYTSALEESHPHIQQAIADCNSGARPQASLQLLLLLAIAFQTFEVRSRVSIFSFLPYPY
jgi:hypothetical protein